MPFVEVWNTTKYPAIGLLTPAAAPLHEILKVSVKLEEGVKVAVVGAVGKVIV